MKDEAQHAPAASAPNRWQRWGGRLLVLAAIVAPFGAAVLVRFVTEPAGRLELLTVGTLTGMIVGQLVGIRHGRLGAFLFGSAWGLVIGYVDLACFAWLIMNTDVSVSVAGQLPILGVGFGVWLACFRRRWWSVLLSLVSLPLVDFASRAGWSIFADMGGLDYVGEYRWLVEPLAYVGLSVCAVQLTPRRALK